MQSTNTSYLIIGKKSMVFGAFVGAGRFFVASCLSRRRPVQRCFSR